MGKIYLGSYARNSTLFIVNLTGLTLYLTYKVPVLYIPKLREGNSSSALLLDKLVAQNFKDSFSLFPFQKSLKLFCTVFH